VVASLTRRGWLVARRQGRDRRRAELALTPSGRALARRLAPVAVEVRAEVESPLAAAELVQVRAALVRVASHLAHGGDGFHLTEGTTAPRSARRRTGAER
jgi:DNA-binding MarR family transcriptional regulator